MLLFSDMRVAGLIPSFLSEDDPRPAVEQIHENYAHGGGWSDFEGFDLRHRNGLFELHYPGDPSYREVSRAKLRDELIVLFAYSWIAVIQPDDTYRIAKID